METLEPSVFREILDGLQSPIYVIDRELNVVFWNSGVEHATGHPRHEMIGRSCCNHELLRCGRTVCDGNCAIRTAFRDGLPRHGSITLHHRSGFHVPVKVRAIPVRAEGDTVVAVAAELLMRERAGDPERRYCQYAAHGCVDPLTRLPNEKIARSALLENQALLIEHGIPFSVLFIELRSFADFKANHGGKAADAMLQVVANTLRSTLRPGDVLVRWSDDRFFAVLAGTQARAVRLVARRLRRVIRSCGIVWWGDHLTVEPDIAGVSSCAGESVPRLIERTDEALELERQRGQRLLAKARSRAVHVQKVEYVVPAAEASVGDTL